MSISNLDAYTETKKPKHYQLIENYNGTLEVRDLMIVLADRLENNYKAIFISDYIQMMQYLLRFDKKGKDRDLKAALFYLEKLISSYKDCELEPFDNDNVFKGLFD